MTPNKNIEEQWEKRIRLRYQNYSGVDCDWLIDFIQSLLDQQRQEIIEEFVGCLYTTKWEDCSDPQACCVKHGELELAISKIKEL